LTTLADVYSYNFPNDRLLVKILGEYKVSPPYHVNDEAISLAYFVFLMETVQTVLTGADIYYWFVEGFGNVERLKDSHLAPIDTPIMHSIVSFVVQGYLCYRIWTLNRRSSKLCVVIALVCVQCHLHPNLLTRNLCIKFTTLQSIGAAWGGISASTI